MKQKQYRSIDLSDGAEEMLTIVKGTTPFYSTWLDAESPYLIQGTQGDHFSGIFDLDGEQISHSLEWEIVAADDIPPDIIAAVEEGWSHGNHVVKDM